MKKIIGMVLSFCFLITLSIPSFAAEKPANTNSSTAAYQAIIDRVNKQYGTDFHFPTADELSKAKLDGNPAAIAAQSVASSEQLEQFEDQLSNAAKDLAKENAESEAAWKAASSKGNTVYSVGEQAP
jgi:hypothetical protein